MTAELATRRRPPTLRSSAGWFFSRFGILIVMLLYFFPFVVMITTAFKGPEEIFSFPVRLLPDVWTLDNFGAALESMPINHYFLNTLIIALACVLGTLISSPLVGYALAKLQFPGKRIVFGTVIATMMLPPQVTFIPLFLIFDRLGLTGTFVPLIAPAFFGTPFFIFLMRQFFLAIPDDLLAAARIDGASEFRIYWSIVLPLAKPALATIAVFQFMWAWTDFLNPLIYLNDERLYTLSLGLYNFFSTHGVSWGPLMAASVAFTIPAVLVFVVAQRFFLQGIATSGLK